MVSLSLPLALAYSLAMGHCGLDGGLSIAGRFRRDDALPPQVELHFAERDEVCHGHILFEELPVLGEDELLVGLEGHIHLRGGDDRIAAQKHVVTG